MNLKHVEILYNGIKQNDKFDELIDKVIEQCFENEHIEKSRLYVSITLTIPKVIQELNLKYRQIDKPTDVLSFPMFEKSELENFEEESFAFEEVLGDIVISIPQVEKQAQEYGHSFERELAYMVVHGFFHLMGYDHMIKTDKDKMREKEDEVLNRLNITRD